MNNLEELIKDIEKSNLLSTPKKYIKSVQFYKIQMEAVNIFKKALANIKPMESNIEIHRLIDAEKPWISYRKFNYKKYIREVDNKFNQLKKKLYKENVSLILEYNPTYHELWSALLSFQIINIDADLYLDTIFYNEIQDMIYRKFNAHPIIVQECLHQVGESVKLKAISVNSNTQFLLYRQDLIKDLVGII